MESIYKNHITPYFKLVDSKRDEYNTEICFEIDANQFVFFEIHLLGSQSNINGTMRIHFLLLSDAPLTIFIHTTHLYPT